MIRLQGAATKSFKMIEKSHKSDFLIVTALKAEADAVVYCLKKTSGRESVIRVDRNGFPYRIINFTVLFCPPRILFERKLKIVITTPNEAGRVPAALHSAMAISEWKPQVVILVGIAAGVKTEVGLADIIIPRFIWDYELQKITKGDGDNSIINYRGPPRQFDNELYASAGSDVVTDWKELIQEQPPKTWREAYQDSCRETSKDFEQRVRHGGIVASGDKSVSVGAIIKALGEQAKQLPAAERKLIGLEMEAGGVFEAVFRATEPKPKFLMIRAVSDYADEKERDELTDEWRPYVLASAAAYTCDFIRKVPIHSYRPSKYLPLSAVIDVDRAGRILDRGWVIVFICNFEVYADFAMSLSLSETDFVLWTSFGSPLRTGSILHGDKLTNYDRAFSEIEAEKYRIVIFRDNKELDEFVTAAAKSGPADLVKRCEAYTQSCTKRGGRLLFSTVNALLDRQIIKIKRSIDEIDLDFGYVSQPGMPGTAGYCFHSPFASTAKPNQISHVSIFDNSLLSPSFDEKENGECRVRYKEIVQSLSDYNSIITITKFEAAKVTRGESSSWLKLRAEELT